VFSFVVPSLSGSDAGQLPAQVIPYGLINDLLASLATELRNQLQSGVLWPSVDVRLLNLSCRYYITGPLQIGAVYATISAQKV
jgi:hypothetical protein